MNGDLLAPGRPGKRAPAGGAAVVAHPNIALIKYWGKRDEQLFLPWTDSLSMPLGIFPTTTSVRVHATADQDALTLNGAPAHGEALRRITAFLDLLRKRAELRQRAVVRSENTVVTELLVPRGVVEDVNAEPGSTGRL
ncbi:hypothetical protein ACH41E_34065 [Streptomyces sp. NPDC020412]|uniref:hypothetical protein n=1 Tax=Streptomyces sp. NPDC020412 TaxID=3365073 RepID=UPI0037BCF173